MRVERIQNPDAPPGEKTAVILAAHSDDQAIGCGGTLLALKKKGYRTVVIIMSQGELSHPWLREDVISAKRKAESIRAMRILTVNETVFLPLTEKELLQAEEDPRVVDTLRELLHELQPALIITHNDEDTHAIHRVVHRLTLQAAEGLSARIIAYDIWTLTHHRRLKHAWLYVDITPYERKKWEAIRAFSSQSIALAFQYLPIHARHLINGLLSGYTLAERFALIREADTERASA